MAETMRAAVAVENGLAVREVPRPVPQAAQILVKVRYAGLTYYCK